MISDSDVVKLILGFKIRHLRLSNKISYQEMSKATGMSVSYLNDIEKGKKYPKPDKIASLAKVFDLEYDALVSTRTDKRLKPVIELLKSGFIKFFPLDEFGISYDYMVISAHRNPEYLKEYIESSDASVFIAIAGLSAALPGASRRWPRSRRGGEGRCRRPRRWRFPGSGGRSDAGRFLTSHNERATCACSIQR